MSVSTQEVCKFADIQPGLKNFDVGHVIHCGRIPSDPCDSETYRILAFCLQTSHLKDVPHEITGEIYKDGKVVRMQCSCKAGLSECCKHVVAVLLYCNRNDLENLLTTTCTDKKCLWNTPQQSSLEKYDAKPLKEHECFIEMTNKTLKAQNKRKKKNNDQTEVGEEEEKELDSSSTQEDLFRTIMIKNLPASALAGHMAGRHAPIDATNNNNIKIDAMRIQALFDNQESSIFLQDLNKLGVEPLQECCDKFMSRLQRNVYVICVETQQYFSVWLEERQFRITGSIAYGIFTYRKNTNPDWEKKSLSYFYPKPLNNCFVKHGLDNEPLARKAYAQSIQALIVVESGLVVSKDNLWLGYSPDGIIFDNDQPLKLFEIKCPYDGKKKKLEEVLKSQTWLIKERGKYSLKKNHSYFTQVQIGMAVLNSPATEFIIYAPFDDKFISFPIEFDPDHAKDLLHSLKKTLFQ